MLSCLCAQYHEGFILAPWIVVRREASHPRGESYTVVVDVIDARIAQVYSGEHRSGTASTLDAAIGQAMAAARARIDAWIANERRHGGVLPCALAFR